jgi:hypothetical protein
MKYRDLISEKDAATFSGISINTLSRFADAGYLQVETGTEGSRFFLRRELESVFGTANSRLKSPSQIKTQKPKSRGTATRTLNQQVEVVKSPNHTSFNQTDSSPPVIEVNFCLDSEIPEKSTNLNDLDYGYFEIDTGSGQQEYSPASQSLAADRPPSPSAEDTADKPYSLSELRRQIVLLKERIKHQESILRLKESELSDLKEQRSWLRGRIEKLEEKGDRDQLLLLSETQMMTHLVSSRTKRSPVKLALDWLGVKDNNSLNTSQSTIVVDKDKSY